MKHTKSQRELIKALSDCIPCLRDQPEFTSELRQAARVLLDHGIKHVCNGYLADDMNAAWTDADRERARTYIIVSVGQRGGRKEVVRFEGSLSEVTELFDCEFERGHHRELEMYADSIAPENLCAAMAIES